LNKVSTVVATDYFVNERHSTIGSWESPKNQKGYTLVKLIKTTIIYEIENRMLNSGDGLCYINENNETDRFMSTKSKTAWHIERLH
jgi:putative protease